MSLSNPSDVELKTLLHDNPNKLQRGRARSSRHPSIINTDDYDINPNFGRSNLTDKLLNVDSLSSSPEPNDHDRSHSREHDHNHSHAHDHSHEHVHTHSHGPEQNLAHSTPNSHDLAPEAQECTHEKLHDHGSIQISTNYPASTMIDYLPILLAVPTWTISANLSLNHYYDPVSASWWRDNLILCVFMTTFVTTALAICARFEIVRFTKGFRTQNQTSDQLCLVLAVGLLVLINQTLGSNRFAPVAIALYVNKLNLYTPFCFIYDLYRAINKEDSSSEVPIFLGYMFIAALVVLTSRFRLATPQLSHCIGACLVATVISLTFVKDLLNVHFNHTMLLISLFASMVVILSTNDLLDMKRQSSQSGSSWITMFQFRVCLALSVALCYVIDFLVLGRRPESIAGLAVSLLGTVVITPTDGHTHSHDTGSHECSHQVPEAAIQEDLAGKGFVKVFMGAVFRDKQKKNVFTFFLLNLSFMFIQLIYSFKSHSLGLLSDSLHMFLDCISMLIGLVASVLAAYPESSSSPFGIRRIETLSGFANGTLLFGIIAEIFFGVVSRLISPVHLEQTNELLIVSALGLGVNVIGAYALSNNSEHSHTHGAITEDGHSHSCGEEANDNMRGIFLHVMADLLGSVGVVCSTLLIKWFKWPGFDPLASLFIAWLLIGHSKDLFKSAAKSLLLSLNDAQDSKLRDLFSTLITIPGVAGFTTPRFWPEQGKMAGYIHIQYFKGENSTIIKKRVEKVFNNAGMTKIWLQIESETDDCWCRKNSGIVAS